MNRLEEKSLPPPFTLTPGERQSGVWQKLVEHMEEQLKNKRGKNDDLALDPIKTAAVRGHIECLKGLIALGEEPPISDGE